MLDTALLRAGRFEVRLDLPEPDRDARRVIIGVHTRSKPLAEDVDLDKLAETGTNICHNCSSNFRLRSGVAPLNRFEAKGINTAIGLDAAGITIDAIPGGFAATDPWGTSIRFTIAP